ncbi:hypothetical protein BJY52DRAFT_900570 [Lactarius psammicola]|nr:hypothetical protein BJY52DRAFT_900570 [Lactarius psammicola]
MRNATLSEPYPLNLTNLNAMRISLILPVLLSSVVAIGAVPLMEGRNDNEGNDIRGLPVNEKKSVNNERKLQAYRLLLVQQSPGISDKHLLTTTPNT